MRHPQGAAAARGKTGCTAGGRPGRAPAGCL